MCKPVSHTVLILLTKINNSEVLLAKWNDSLHRSMFRPIHPEVSVGTTRHDIGPLRRCYHHQAASWVFLKCLSSNANFRCWDQNFSLPIIAFAAVHLISCAHGPIFISAFILKVEVMNSPVVKLKAVYYSQNQQLKDDGCVAFKGYVS